MHIDAFEQQVDDRILVRGRQYYNNGRVREFALYEDGCFDACVDGSEPYEVQGRLAENGQLTITCDCPFDQDAVCKHIVAVLLTLRAQQKKAPTKQKSNLRALLLAQSKETLVSELLDLAKSNRSLRQALLFRYGDAENEIESSRKLVRQCMQQRDYWAYGTADDALEGAWTVLKRAERLAESDPERAVKLCLVVLPEAISLTGYCDDSNGEIGEVFYFCKELLTCAVVAAQEKLSEAECTDLFQAISDESRSTVYDGWNEYRLDLLDLLQHFSGHASLREKQFQRLEDEQERPLEGYAQYYQEGVAMLRLELWDMYGMAEEAERFRSKNMAFPNIRKSVIDRAMEQQDYAVAAQLAREGMTQDQQYAGLVHRWRTALYKACEAMGDQASVLELAEYFILHERDGFDYYPVLKRNTDPKVWPGVLDGLLESLENTRPSAEVYTSILLEERDFDRLLTFVQNHPYALPDLAGRFPSSYHDQLSAEYRQLILHRAEKASSRSHYQGVCTLLRRFGKDISKTAMGQLTNELKTAYPRRPAFQDELGRIH